MYQHCGPAQPAHAVAIKPHGHSAHVAAVPGPLLPPGAPQQVPSRCSSVIPQQTRTAAVQSTVAAAIQQAHSGSAPLWKQAAGLTPSGSQPALATATSSAVQPPPLLQSAWQQVQQAMQQQAPQTVRQQQQPAARQQAQQQQQPVAQGIPAALQAQQGKSVVAATAVCAMAPPQASGATSKQPAELRPVYSPTTAHRPLRRSRCPYANDAGGSEVGPSSLVAPSKVQGAGQHVWRPVPTPMRAAEEGGAWSTRWAVRLGGEGDEKTIAGRMIVFDRQSVSSVADAVERLNRRLLPCLEDFCAVFSAKDRSYYMLWRSGCEQAAYGRAGIATLTPPTSASLQVGAVASLAAGTIPSPHVADFPEAASVMASSSVATSVEMSAFGQGGAGDGGFGVSFFPGSTPPPPIAQAGRLSYPDSRFSRERDFAVGVPASSSQGASRAVRQASAATSAPGSAAEQEGMAASVVVEAASLQDAAPQPQRLPMTSPWQQQQHQQQSASVCVPGKPPRFAAGPSCQPSATASRSSAAGDAAFQTGPSTSSVGEAAGANLPDAAPATACSSLAPAAGSCSVPVARPLAAAVPAWAAGPVRPSALGGATPLPVATARYSSPTPGSHQICQRRSSSVVQDRETRGLQRLPTSPAQSPPPGPLAHTPGNQQPQIFLPRPQPSPAPQRRSAEATPPPPFWAMGAQLQSQLQQQQPSPPAPPQLLVLPRPITPRRSEACRPQNIEEDIEDTRPAVSRPVRESGGLVGLERVDYKALTFVESLGSGEFGQVFRGIYKSEEVAIKQLFWDDAMSSVLMKDLAREIESFRELRHRRLVRFIGACFEWPHPCLITEYMAGGSLHNFLHEQKRRLPTLHATNMCLQVVDGVMYLHERNPKIVHRDLKSLNVVLDLGLNIKLCDFGLTEKMERTHITKRNNGGSPRYMAPELFCTVTKITEKIDIWAMGCIFVEIFGGPLPFSDLQTLADLTKSLLVRRRAPDVPPHLVPLEVQVAIHRCLEFEINVRPGARDVYEDLKEAKRLMRESGQIQ
eukprot:TRINITY_DN20887_c0_g1_i3.p1 TRINITY_DN20887_c0_g1~~TRINITY_DN20887_c0_g1_i3.p1  ORF type:complete len:1029 (+),score=195.97 TRINITY_DN20887_c0_g1_i3:111-3197(+)